MLQLEMHTRCSEKVDQGFNYREPRGSTSKSEINQYRKSEILWLINPRILLSIAKSQRLNKTLIHLFAKANRYIQVFWLSNQSSQLISYHTPHLSRKNINDVKNTLGI